MAKEKGRLTAFTLKLSDQDRLKMKMVCALDKSFQFQYHLLDAAVVWASANKHDLIAIANPKDGENRSYYLSDEVHRLRDLEEAWNCNTTRALHTAVVHYLKQCEKDL